VSLVGAFDGGGGTAGSLRGFPVQRDPDRKNCAGSRAQAPSQRTRSSRWDRRGNPKGDLGLLDCSSPEKYLCEGTR